MRKFVGTRPSTYKKYIYIYLFTGPWSHKGWETLLYNIEVLCLTVYFICISTHSLNHKSYIHAQYVTMILQINVYSQVPVPKMANRSLNFTFVFPFIVKRPFSKTVSTF